MNAAEPVRVLIADDHYVVREGLVALIEAEPDMRVVAQASSGERALEACRQHTPGVVLLDMRMPGQGGLATIAQIKKGFPGARVLVFSGFSGDEEIYSALEAGACGYILKSSFGEELIKAIRAAYAGSSWILREVATRLAVRKIYEPLTSREPAVLTVIAQGAVNKEIASSLNVSEYTVKDHIKHILRKLRVGSRTETVTVAVQRGIVDLGEFREER